MRAAVNGRPWTEDAGNSRVVRGLKGGLQCDFCVQEGCRSYRDDNMYGGVAERAAEDVATPSEVRAARLSESIPAASRGWGVEGVEKAWNGLSAVTG